MIDCVELMETKVLRKAVNWNKRDSTPKSAYLCSLRERGLLSLKVGRWGKPWG